MKMKKWVILLVCVALLCGLLGASIAIVNAQGDSEPEDSDSIPTSQEAASDAVESTAPSENKPIEEPIDKPIDKPNDPPMVVTRSLVQEEPESEIIDMYDKALLQKALDTYAGQNVTFRVVVSVSYYQEWNDSAKVDGFYSFHRLIGIDHCTCTMCDAYRQTHQDEAGKPVYGDLHRGEFSGEFYITEEVVCDAIGFEPHWYAELDEASLRALIGCGGPIVALIDEFPEPLWLEFPYNTPSAPAIVTLSHMMELTGAERGGEDADLIQEALKLYAGQNVLYRIQGAVHWELESVRDDFRQKSENRTVGKLYWCPDYALPAVVGVMPMYFGELNEEELRALLSCDVEGVTLIDELPEHLLPYNEPAVS